MTPQPNRNPEEGEVPDESLSLTEIAKTLGENPQSVIRAEFDGRRSLAIMSWDEYEALVETLDVLGDTEAMDSLRRAESQIEAGKGRRFSDVVAALGF